MKQLELGPIEIVPHPQGSEGWLTERSIPGTCCASEAPAVMNVSPHLTRDKLIAKMAVGHEKEFSQFVRERILDRGHTSEAAARVLLEEDLGEDLAPLTLKRTVDGMRWLASLDGQTMAETTLMEHKDWNLDLVAHIKLHGEPPEDKCFQMEHQLLVADAQVVKFVCSDGTRENRVVCDYTSKPERRYALIAGWKQLLADVANYAPPAASAPAPVAKTVEQLPALFCQTDVKDGKLVVRSNLAEFKPKALAYIAAIPATLETDQHFADADVDAKFCRSSAATLELTVEQMLGQMVDVQSVVGTVRELVDAFNKKARALEVAIDDKKKRIKEDEITRGRKAAEAHIADLNAQLGKPYMPSLPHDFMGACKNVRSIDSLRNKVNSHLADFKIMANERFAGINRNLTWLRENGATFTFLFADTRELVTKPHTDFIELCTARIDNHKADLARKEAADRERIRAEEAARLEREATARAREESARQLEQQRQATAAAPTPTPTPTPAPSTVVQATFAAPVQPEKPALQLVPAGPPTLNLGRINERIAPLGITVSGLEKLGFPVAGKQGAASLFHEADYPRMVRAMAEHLMHSTVDRVDAA